MIRRLTAVLVAVSLALCPALAAFNSLTLLSSAQQTASGNGAWIQVSTSDQLVVVVDFTAGTTVTALDLWIQGTNDSTDTTGFDVTCDQRFVSAPTSTTSPTVAAQRDIIDNKSTTTAERFVCLVRNFPFKYARAKWLFTGTNFTLSVTAGSK